MVHIIDCPLSEADIQQCVSVVNAGRLLVVPTDTVYGIGTNPANAAAVRALLGAKGRTEELPPPVLVGDVAQARALAGRWPEAIDTLTRALWPGALTVVVPACPTAALAWDTARVGGTVALRMPAHDDLLKLLRRTGALAVTSANLHGRPPATDADQARAAFGEAVACYVDAGPTPGPVPSTIVRARAAGVEVVREGVHSRAAIGALVPVSPQR